MSIVFYKLYQFSCWFSRLFKVFSRQFKATQASQANLRMASRNFSWLLMTYQSLSSLVNSFPMLISSFWGFSGFSKLLSRPTSNLFTDSEIWAIHGKSVRFQGFLRIFTAFQKVSRLLNAFQGSFTFSSLHKASQCFNFYQGLLWL